MHVLFAFTYHIPDQQYLLFCHSYTAEEGLRIFLGWRQQQGVLEYTRIQSYTKIQIYDLGEWWADNLEPTLLITIIRFLTQGHNLNKTIN